MKNTILVFVCSLFFTTLSAQKKPVLHGALRAGLLEGEAGGNLLLQALSGIRYQTWSFDLGTGIDYYQQRSIPVFLQVQKALASTPKAAFVYAGGGHHFPWLKPEEKHWDGWENKGGFYGDAGIGYSLPVAKTSALQFSLGYSVKTMTVREDYAVIGIWPSPVPSFAEERRVYRRLSLKMGLRF